jgi:hypothetical protein
VRELIATMFDSITMIFDSAIMIFEPSIAWSSGYVALF